MAEIDKNQLEDIRSKVTQELEELEQIEKESESQKLPEQKTVFKSDSIKSRAKRRGVHNLPDQTNPPMGFDPDKAYDSVFPFVKLPFLQPNTPEDNVSFGSPELEPNRIYFGDNLHVLRALKSNSIDLIYIDPPFFSGREYNQIWGDDNEIRTFYDIWEDGLPSYLVWLNARVWEMKRILKNTGSIYVHCDWHASHYIKTEMDKIFGYENLRNEIIWKRSTAHSDAKQGAKHFGRIHDIILFYTKSDKYIFNTQYTEHSEDYINKFYKHVEPKTGRRYMLDNLAGPGGAAKGNPYYEVMGVKRHWQFSQEKMKQLIEEGRIIQTDPGNVPRYKRYLDEMKGLPLQSMWDDIKPIQSQSSERLGYPTQKPETLLERFIKVSSNEGDVVADFFMGGGTTCAVAQRLNRKFIGCDISRVASSLTLNRLLRDGEQLSGRTASTNVDKPKKGQSHLEITISKIPDIKVYYLGVYPIEKFSDMKQEDFENFILTSYGARRFTGEGDLTGVMNASTTLLVGATDTTKSISEERLKKYVQDSLRLRYQENIRMKLKVIAWVFPPSLQKYAKILENYFFKENIAVDIELVPINSQLFRKRILEHYPDAGDSEFLLKFVIQPSIADISFKRLASLKYEFEAVGARSNNLDGYLINCQWDFDFRDGLFADTDYSLMREQKDGKYVAVLKATKEFEKSGKYLVACRVQDNLGGEAVITKEVEVK